MILADISDWIMLTGRLHPLVVHLPIGILLTTALLEFIANIKRYGYIKEILPTLWLLGAISAIFSCVAGFSLAQDGGYEDALLSTHQWLGIAVAAIAVGGYILKKFNMQSWGGSASLSIVTVILLSGAGHYGGTLTHGEDFLNAPVYAILNIEEDSDDQTLQVSSKAIDHIEEAIVYRDLIEPMLEQKCMRCHNEKKKKGELSLATYSQLINGGEAGASVTPGEPLKSELYKRLVLPIDDKHRMPPKGKSQLTKKQIALIHWWIEEGKASADMKVKELTPVESMKSILASLSHGEADAEEQSGEKELPDVKVSDVPAEALKTLGDAGLVVTSLSPDYPFLSVNCINNQSFNDSLTALLLPFKDQIVWLRAGNTQITDLGMTNILKLKNLTRLSIEYTNVTDKSLANIAELKHLQYLNLVGSKVSDKSLPYLRAAKKLKAVYLWKTLFSPSGIRSLKDALPATEVSGGENRE